jgi:hypothetical protein
MDKNFGGVIWTNHALERMSARKISQSDAWATWRNPQASRKAKIPGAWIYYRTYGSERIEVIAKKMPPAQKAFHRGLSLSGAEPGPAGKGEWIILSVWSRPVGEARFATKKTIKTTPFWKLIIKQILGK